MWSLSVEETFYLLFPLACLPLRRPAALLAGMLPLIVIRARSIAYGSQDLEPWDEFSYLGLHGRHRAWAVLRAGCRNESR